MLVGLCSPANRVRTPTWLHSPDTYHRRELASSTSCGKPLLTLHDPSRVLRHNPPVNNMHLGVEFAIPISARLKRTHMSSITIRIPTLIRITTRKAPGQRPQCVQLLARKPSIMARFASWLRTLSLEEVIITEFLRAKPYDHRLFRVEWRVDSLTLRIAKDGGLWGVDSGTVLCVAEDVWEREALECWQCWQWIGCTTRSLEQHEASVGCG